MIRTTKKHFEAFKKRCLYWIKRLSLDDWEVAFSHDELDRQRACITYLAQGRVATIFLTTHWTDPVTKLTLAEVRRCAKHEVLHLLLADLCTVVTDLNRSGVSGRFVTQDEFLKTQESLVRKLERIVT